MKQYCSVATEYLGLKGKDAEVTWDNIPEGDKFCSYYKPVQEDPDKPEERDKACGNCVFYYVTKE